MKKLFKILAALAVIFIVLVVGAAFVLRQMFPPEKVHQMVYDYVKTNYNREIKFDDVSFRLIGLDLANFAVSEKGTFQNGTFAKADSFVVKIALKPLFRKDIRVSTIGLEGFHANIIKDAKGVFNFADLIPSESSPAAAAQSKTKAGGELPVTFNVDKFYIAASSVNYKDQQSGASASVTDFNLNVKNFKLDGEFNADASLKVSYADKDIKISAPADVSALVNLKNNDLNAAYVKIKNLTAAYNGAALETEGTITGFNNPVADIKGALTGVTQKTAADFADGIPNFVLPPVKFASKINTNLDKSTADIESFSVSLPKTAAKGNASVNWGGKTLVYGAAVNFNAFVDELAAIAPELTAAYKPGGSVSGDIVTTNKNLVKGAVKFNHVEGVYEKTAAVKELTGSVTINSTDDIKTDTLKGKLNDAAFTAAFAMLKTNANTYKIKLDFDLASFTLKELPAASASSSQPAAKSAGKTAAGGPLFDVAANIKVGKITVPHFFTDGVTLTADLTGLDETFAKTNGLVNFNMDKGEITDVKAFLDSNKIAKVLFAVVGVVQKAFNFLNLDILQPKNGASKDAVPFDYFTGVYNFKNGVMAIDKTKFSSRLSTIQADGTVDFVTDKLNLKVNANLGKGGNPVTMKVGGTIDAPKPGLDVLSTAASLVPGLAAGGAGTAKDAVSNTVNTAKNALKGLGGLLKKPAASSDSAAK